MAVKKITPQQLVEFCTKCAEEKLARDVVALDIPQEAGVADYFVIATVDSQPQLQAVSSFIERQVREKYELRSGGRSGDDTCGGWSLLDYGTVVVHIMLEETRARYDLESLWGKVADKRKQQED